MIEVEVSNRQAIHPVNSGQIIAAVRLVLEEAGIRGGAISIAVVDDPTIHQLNRQFLDHDYPTDVLSFLLSHDDTHLDGEIIISADTAARSAAEYQWEIDGEMLLYAVHGALHLTGYDDATAAQQQVMRERERHYLAQFGWSPPES